ncbi:hypothetical protein ANANG_G00252880 [Anguilla anguilla]|uniref:Uncharacterized protein n=1 Tax=Anguilla anguilla TaxID=7936 RepID=A0A9D3RN21_ANGAN|nr:hypothetical protein ANANG_G00252880 [Anguilla anguilla]
MLRIFSWSFVKVNAGSSQAYYDTQLQSQELCGLFAFIYISADVLEKAQRCFSIQNVAYSAVEQGGVMIHFCDMLDILRCEEGRPLWCLKKLQQAIL